MPEKAHEAILNRGEPIAVAQEHLSAQLAMLRDLANYGSNLIIRAYESSPKGMTDIVVCGVLLKQLVAMVDSAEVLLSSGCGHAAHLPARTAFEASIYIDFIFSKDSERRATRYVVANYRDERLWTARVTPGTQEEIDFSKISKGFGIDIQATRPTIAAEAAEHLKEVNRILAQPELAAIDQEFTAARGNKRYDPEWYALDGPKSIRQVAVAVGKEAEYDFFYSKGSQVAHTGTYKDHLRFGDGEMRFKPIRHLADVNMLLNFIGATTMGTYRKILERYRSGEIAAFNAKYANEWRQPFLNVVSIEYDF